MALCPDGHQSASTDYCDECGLSMGAAAGSAVSGGGAPGYPGGTLGVSTVAMTLEPCPNCLLPRTDDPFCEGCGFDFENQAPNLTATVPAPDPAPVPPPAPTTPAPSPNGTARWTLVATADRAYYDSVVADGEIDPNSYPFPPFCPERRFTLAGDNLRIGRTSATKGAVEIALTGPPTDPGISHLNAVLQVRPDGGWTISDPGSTNGTVLNDDTAAIPRNQAIPIEPGFRIHVGVWTTLTLVRE